MSIMPNTVDYESNIFAWKIPPKKMIELKANSVHQVNVNQSTEFRLPSAVNHQGHTINITTLNSNPTQQIHTTDSTIVLHHNLQNRQIIIEETHLPQPLHSIVQIQPAPSIQQSQIQNEQQPQQQQVENNQVKLKKPQKHKIKVKKRRIPVDGMAYHSKQLGLKVPPKKTLGIKGMVIHCQTREVIHNVYKFMKDEAQNGTKIPLANYRERVLAATGISKCTYSKITSKEFVNGLMVECALPKRKKKGVKIDESVPDGSLNENESIYRPKINRDASTRDGIYNLEELVPTTILATLENEALKIINDNSIDDLGLCEFVSANIKRVLGSNIYQNAKVRNITIFLYINYLIQFMNTPMKFVTKKFVVCDKSTEVNSHILDNFSLNGPNGRTRPVHMKDKALCYIIILSALGIDYEVDLANLAKDCKIGVKKALEISRILAFNTSSKNKTVVTLKLPLPAPVMFTPKRKRK